jgi:hypothetical protein
LIFGSVALGASGRGCASFGSEPADGGAEGAANVDPVDGGGERVSDAGVDADATSGCDATFCDDFDDGPLGARWVKQEADGGELALSPGHVSPPHALRATLRAADAGARRTALLSARLGNARRIDCSFMFLGESLPPSGAGRDMDVIRIAVEHPAYVRYSVQLSIAEASSRLREDVHRTDRLECDCPLGRIDIAERPAGWTPVHLSADFRAVKVWFGTKLVGQEDLSGPPDGGDVTVYLGATTNDPGGGSVLFDDFSCTVTP